MPIRLQRGRARSRKALASAGAARRRPPAGPRLAVLLLLAFRCDGPGPRRAELRTEAPPASGSEGPAGGAEPAQSAPRSGPGTWSGAYAKAARIVAIGDLHGDYSATRAALRLAGALGAGDAWVGGRLTLVQTGDQLDRGDGERAIVDLFDKLAEQARVAGGRVVALNGNHETMNVAGDFRYVTPLGLEAFDGSLPPSPYAARAPARFRSRAAALLPGGPYARRLARRAIVAQVGGNVFVHGGVLPEHLDYGLDRINREARAWMLGKTPPPQALLSERAPVWARTYSADPVDARECELLGQVLRRMGAVRMVVGHTTQKQGISSACGERVFRIDVGLSDYYGSGPIQVLELTPQGVRILSEPRAVAP